MALLPVSPLRAQPWALCLGAQKDICGMMCAGLIGAHSMCGETANHFANFRQTPYHLFSCSTCPGCREKGQPLMQN